MQSMSEGKGSAYADHDTCTLEQVQACSEDQCTGHRYALC